MMGINMDAIKQYAPIAGRYAATALVGLLVAMLNHFKINLDPVTVNALTVGLTGMFVALLLFAFRNKAVDQTAIVNTSVHAALTGEIPATVAAKATPAQIAAIEASPVASVKNA